MDSVDAVQRWVEPGGKIGLEGPPHTAGWLTGELAIGTEEDSQPLVDSEDHLPARYLREKLAGPFDPWGGSRL